MVNGGSRIINHFGKRDIHALHVKPYFKRGIGPHGKVSMRSHNFDLSTPLYLDRMAAMEAQDLLAKHGEAASEAAAARARESRNLGNHIAFCRWRQIERLIAVLCTDAPVGTRH